MAGINSLGIKLHNPQEAQDDMLRQFLHGAGERDIQASKENAEKEQFARGKQTLEDLMAKNPDKDVSVAGVGSVGQKKDDMLSWLRFQEMQNEHLNGNVTGMGKRVEQQDIPGAVSQLKGVGSSIPPKGEPFKSYGPLKNIIPDMAVAPLEHMGFMKKGASAERQSIGALKSMTRHPLYGSSLTPNEKGDFENSFGAPIGASEDQLRSNIERMQSIPVEAMSNIEASTTPKAVERFREQGGLSSEQIRSSLNPQAPVGPDQTRAPSSTPQSAAQAELARRRAAKQPLGNR